MYDLSSLRVDECHMDKVYEAANYMDKHKVQELLNVSKESSHLISFS